MLQPVSHIEFTDDIYQLRDQLRGKRWTLIEGEGPIIATALHDGRTVRDEVLAHMSISEADRSREEDPFTSLWTTVSPTRLIVHHSRFEVDQNRPRDNAIYLTPAQSWGLRVWKKPLPPEIVARTLSYYDAFYLELKELIERKLRKYPRIFVFDMHTYNHHRLGPNQPFDPPEKNPEVDLINETSGYNYEVFGALWNRLHRDIRAFDYFGRQLDVRSNVRFQVAYLSTWIQSQFPGQAASIQFEIKKFFMDEWTGIPDHAQLEKIRDLYASLIPGVVEELQKQEVE